MIAAATLSSPEILNLFDVPKQLIAAPGPNKLILPVMSYSKKLLIGTPYTIAGIVDFYLGPERGFSDADDQFGLTAAADVNNFAPPMYNFIEVSGADAAVNQPLVIRATIANPTGGDGVLHIWVLYQIIDVS